MLRKVACATTIVMVGFALAGTVHAQERLTLKSAKSSSSYYVMMVQLSEMVKEASDGEVLPTVEESQGSVQNVKESFVRSGNFLFTTPPSLLAAAREGEAPFEGEANEEARTLFVMPFVTVHFVVGEDAGVDGIADLAGKTFIAGGKGTFCEKRSSTILEALGLLEDIDVVEVELSAAGPAMRDGKVDGFATCSSHPTPQLVELATTTPVKVLSFTDEQRETVLELDPLSGPLTIAAGTYEGQEQPVQTVGVPVGAYGTTRMSDDVAYFITSTFWEWKEKLASENRWWQGVQPSMIRQMGVELHPGARRYYEEEGVEIPSDLR